MRRMGMLALASLLAGGLVLGVAEAQKPPPAGAPTPAPAGKPAPMPPPTQAPAVPGKRGGEAPATPAPATPAPGAPAPGAPAPDAPAAPRAQAPTVQPPIDEPTAIGRLRSLLGPNSTLAYTAAEVTDPARGTVRLTGVTITSNGKPLRIESLALDDLRDDGLGEADARNLSFQDGTTRVTLERAQLAGLTVRPAPTGQPRTADLVTLDSLRVEGLLVRDGPDSEVRLAQAVLEDYGPGRQTRFSLGGLAVKLKPGDTVESVTLRRAVLRGMDVATIATMVSRNQTPPTAGRLALELEEVVATGPNNRPVAGIGSLRLTSDQPEGGVGVGNFAVRALRLNPVAGMDTWMRRLGYTALLFDLTADSRYDPVGGRMELTSLSLVGRDIGTLSLAFGADGAAAAAMQNGDWSGLRLLSAGLRYIDQGLFGRLMAQQAREGRTPEAQLREQYANMAGGVMAQPALAPVREAVQRFIRGQAHEVEITLHPPQPVPLAEFQQPAMTNPAEAAQRLGLGAVAR